ncbi:MAG: hypothetical protein GY749_05520 [Desulfobacteraceae bacterium]|nr:hypothetical protein [Desulfobacteraceae bacterium]
MPGYCLPSLAGLCSDPAIHDTVGKFYSFMADTSDAAERQSDKAWADAAERQSDKAWGFEPQVGIVVNFCDLKGRREGRQISFPASLQGADPYSALTWGSKPQALSLCRSAASEVSAPETVEFTNSIINCRAILCRP